MKVGLFGTCGSSTWRTQFVEAFQAKNIAFFNPQLPEGVWTADRADEFVQVENQNLKSNEIVLFPVTNETTGQGSLAEIGFSVLDTMRNLNDRFLIVLIDTDCIDPKATESQIEESKRSRKLVRSKVELEVRSNPKVFLVESLDEMQALSLELHTSLCDRQNIRERYSMAV